MTKEDKIEVEKPRLTLRNTGFIIGAIILISGIIFMVTIVMIIPGMIAFTIGITVVYANTPITEVICAFCGTVNIVTPPDKRIECEACSANIPIKWKKPSA